MLSATIFSHGKTRHMPSHVDSHLLSLCNNSTAFTCCQRFTVMMLHVFCCHMFLVICCLNDTNQLQSWCIKSYHLLSAICCLDVTSHLLSNVAGIWCHCVTSHLLSHVVSPLLSWKYKSFAITCQPTLSWCYKSSAIASCQPSAVMILPVICCHMLTAIFSHDVTSHLLSHVVSHQLPWCNKSSAVTCCLPSAVMM